MIYLDLYVVKTKKVFRKYFNTEFERDKFRYSKNIMVKVVY